MHNLPPNYNNSIIEQKLSIVNNIAG
jgi:hypothetical protein